MNHFSESVFEPKVTQFKELCLDTFRFQYERNIPYKKYCQFLGIENPDNINRIHDIPFMPVELFKNNNVQSFEGRAEKIFLSSGTGFTGQSKHPIYKLSLYEKSFVNGFQNYFGEIPNHCILGLLPSYLEREGSSLIYMVNHLMQVSGHPLNGFFLFEHDTLAERIKLLEEKKETWYLFGVSFALLDFAERYSIPIQYGKIIETGGMKGRKKEIVKNELYKQLIQAFHTQEIYSEYGMTELLSQAYANADGRYHVPEQMKVFAVDPNDPLSEPYCYRTGLLRIIDLANFYSCSFLQTSDLGKVYPNGTFEVLGRLDNSDLRGCSLLLGS